MSIFYIVWSFANAAKPVLSDHSKIDKTNMLMINGSLMKVECITECSKGSILFYFWPAFRDNRSWKTNFGLFFDLSFKHYGNGSVWNLIFTGLLSADRRFPYIPDNECIRTSIGFINLTNSSLCCNINASAVHACMFLLYFPILLFL